VDRIERTSKSLQEMKWKLKVLEFWLILGSHNVSY